MKHLPGFLLALATASPAFAQATQPAMPGVVSGQPQATSANYRHDSAIAADASGVATSTNYANRPGYVGQLYNVTALTLAATPGSVNERATTQLAAGALLDDGSLLVPPSSDVSWTVVSGPLTAVAVDGTVTAATVYQTSTATVQGTYGDMGATLVVTVLNLTADDFGPYAGDGLPDDWQVTHFGPDSATAGPTLDPDGDGRNNLLEYLAGTTPTLGTSVFSVRIENVADQSAQQAIVFGPVAAGRTYRVLASTDLTAPSWADISGALTGTSGNLSFADSTAGAPSKFYRVQISNP